MRAVITGAAGKIGRQLVEEFSGLYELHLLDLNPVPGHDSVFADLANADSKTESSGEGSASRPVHWSEGFVNADVIIHLAQGPSEKGMINSIRMTWNVLQAAVQHRVNRVVYASSNWAVKGLELSMAPGCYAPDGPKIGSDAEPQPRTAYGVAKTCGEMTGRMLVEEQNLDSFIAVRIGCYDPNPQEDEYYHRMGISTRDIRSLFRSCIERPFKGFHVVYGVSAQTTAPYDLSYTRRLLSWEPHLLP